MTQLHVAGCPKEADPRNETCDCARLTAPDRPALHRRPAPRITLGNSPAMRQRRHPPLSHRDLARMRTLINELCILSRDGWRNARPEDYMPLEAELRQLLARQ